MLQIVKTNVKCYKCKKGGDHHTVLCNLVTGNGNPREGEITYLFKNNTNILLQTTNALIADKN